MRKGGGDVWKGQLKPRPPARGTFWHMKQLWGRVPNHVIASNQGITETGNLHKVEVFFSLLFFLIAVRTRYTRERWTERKNNNNKKKFLKYIKSYTDTNVSPNWSPSLCTLKFSLLLRLCSRLEITFKVTFEGQTESSALWKCAFMNMVLYEENEEKGSI